MVSAGMALSLSVIVMAVKSMSNALTAATADGGGPACGMSEPMASQVMLTHDASEVPAAACVSEFRRRSVRSSCPSFAPNCETMCNLLTLAAVFLKPPMATLSATSFSVRGSAPRSGSVVNVTRSAKLYRMRFSVWSRFTCSSCSSPVAAGAGRLDVLEDGSDSARTAVYTAFCSVAAKNLWRRSGYSAVSRGGGCSWSRSLAAALSFEDLPGQHLLYGREPLVGGCLANVEQCRWLALCHLLIGCEHSPGIS